MGKLTDKNTIPDISLSDLLYIVDKSDLSSGSKGSTTKATIQQLLDFLITNGISTSQITLGNILIITGSGTPEGVQTAPVGSIYTDDIGGVGTTLYIKESGVGNTGWIAK